MFTKIKNLNFSELKTNRVRRWRLIMEEYGPTIRYCEGKHKLAADIFSHHPIAEQSLSEDLMMLTYSHSHYLSFPLTNKATCA
jgi:hypothetical protein